MQPWEISVDLAGEFDRFTKTYGKRVTYVRRNVQIKCRCTDKGEPNPNCPVCYGTGCKVSVEHPTARRSRYWGSDSMHGLIQPQPLGYVDSDAWVYYFEERVCPKEKDLVIEDKTYLIRRVHDPEVGAEIAFYRCICDINVKGKSVYDS